MRGASAESLVSSLSSEGVSEALPAVSGTVGDQLPALQRLSAYAPVDTSGDDCDGLSTESSSSEQGVVSPSLPELNTGAAGRAERSLSSQQSLLLLGRSKSAKLRASKTVAVVSSVGKDIPVVGVVLVVLERARQRA